MKALLARRPQVPSLNAIALAVIGICELGLARMQELRHEYNAVRELTQELCVMALG